ncbi:Uu.00g138470.m01.CDS01 [Anthostomella pinea]|uniref:Uu.00g138470.m01.CDS01 n=1 Tax=Anthostomella pinea TaxID=933095 RepID=A0AAI8YIS9_9PEZI|nr:Uu.00g138470.m01.CDS01 [Anthostomella pinea]
MASQLAHIPEVKRLSPACMRILAGNPSKFTLQGTNTYLVGTGSDRLLIDTGEGKPSWLAALKRVLDDEKATVEKALLTHWHHDHTEGVLDLLELSPHTAVYKCDPTEGQLDIADGQTFEVEGATLTAVHTPGHTTDHMAFILQEEDSLFTGDNVLGQGTAVFEDLGTYLKSLARMERLVSGRAYPGHGPMVSDAKAKIAEYISHRHQREVQVLQTLGSAKDAPSMSPSDISEQVGAWTPMELVKVIYRDVPESLHLPASGGVVQILRKLRDEDRVVLEDGDRWRLKGRPSL